MSATHSTNWFWTDWLGDISVRRLTPTERGVWIDLLALASTANPVGYVCDAKGTPLTLEEIARVTNAASPHEVEKLISGIIEKGAASVDRRGRLFNRRMVREAEIRAKKAQAGKRGAARTNMIFKEKTGPPRHLPRQAGNGMEKESASSGNILRGEDSGDARARATSPSKTPLISPEAHALADQITGIVGHDPKYPPVPWYGAAMHVQKWLSEGWLPELILIAVHRLAEKKAGDPPHSIKFFEQEIAREHARQAAPLPKVKTIEGQEIELGGNHGSSTNRDSGSGGLALGRIESLKRAANE